MSMVALCALAVCANAQGQPTVAGPDVCPPTGNLMGQSNYQRAPHPATSQPTAAPVQPSVTPAPAAITPPPEIGAGPKIDATPGERRNIAVDDNYVYVLQGDQVMKLDKSDLHVVARTRLPANRK